MYIRNLRKPSANKNVFKFASHKNQASILCESSLEKDCCFHFEYDSEVVAYESQPVGFYYDFEGKQLPYTPDFLVRYIDGTSQFVENKPYKKTLTKEFKKKFKQRQIAARRLGIELILVTDKQIRAGYFLKNCQLVHRYSGCIESDLLTDKVLDCFDERLSMKVNDLASLLCVTIGSVLAAALRLVSIGKLWVDLDSNEINAHSVFGVV